MIVVKKEFDQLPQLQGEVRRRARDIVRKASFDLQALITTAMQGPKHGRLYRRSGKPHQASAPGEAPAIDYGVLVGSIQVDFPEELTGVVSTNTEYSVLLEFGGVKLAARPFMRPAAQDEWPAFEQAMTQLLGGR